MIKRFLLALLFILLAGQVFAATVYVKKIDGIVYYEAGASSCDDVTSADTSGDIEAALTAAGASGFCYICAGTYSGTDIDASDGLDTTASNQTIEGVGAAILDGSSTSDDMVTFNHANLLLKNLTIQNVSSGNSAMRFIGSGSAESVISKDNAKHISSTSATNSCTLTKCRFSGASESAIRFGHVTAGTGEWVFRGCIIDNTSYDSPAVAVYSVTSGTFNNCVFIGNVAGSIIGWVDGTITLNNCISVGESGLKTTHNTIKVDAAFTGSIVANNCILLPSAYSCNDASYDYSIDTITDCIETSPPKWSSARREAIYSIVIDDYNNYDLWKDIADYAQTKGVYTVLGLHNTDNATAEEYTEMAGYVSAGHEIACHTRNHSVLTNLDAIDVTSVDTNPTIDTSITTTSNDSGDWTGTVILREDGTQVGSTINITAVTTLNSLVTFINTQGGGDWTATLNASADGDSHAKCIESTTFTIPDTLTLDEENFWYVEIAESKAEMEAGLGSRVRSFISPGNNTSADLRSYIMDDSTIYAGHFANAGTTAFDVFRGGSGGSRFLEDVDFAQLSGPHIVNELLGSTTANYERNAYAIGVFAAWRGMNIAPYAHAELSLTYWQDFIDDSLEVTGVQFKTLSGFYDYIAGSSAWTDDGDYSYSRTYSDNWYPKIKRTSDAVDAGENVSDLYGETDYFGDPQYGPWDIGIHERQPSGGNNTISIGGGGIGIW